MGRRFNSWIDKWGLIEFSTSNKSFTWTNNQDIPTFAKIDRIFVTTEWESAFPLAVLKHWKDYLVTTTL